jgi:hypothetical protein
LIHQQSCKYIDIQFFSSLNPFIFNRESSITSTIIAQRTALANIKPKVSQDATVSSTHQNNNQTSNLRQTSYPFLKSTPTIDTPAIQPASNKRIIISSSSSSSSSDDDEETTPTQRRTTPTVNTSSTPKSLSKAVKTQNGKTIAKKIEFTASSSSGDDTDDEEPPAKPQTNKKETPPSAQSTSSKQTSNQLIGSIKSEKSKKNDEVVELPKQTPAPIRLSFDSTHSKSSSKPAAANKEKSFLDLGNNFTSFDDYSIKDTQMGFCNFDAKPLPNAIAGRMPQPLFSVYNSFSQVDTSQQAATNFQNSEENGQSTNGTFHKNNNDRYYNSNNNRGPRQYDNNNYSGGNRGFRGGNNSAGSHRDMYRQSGSDGYNSWRGQSSEYSSYSNGSYNNNNRYNNNYKNGYQNNKKYFDDQKSPAQKIIDKNRNQEDSDEEKRKMKIKTVKDIR